MADAKALLATFNGMRTAAGPAPGLDGVTYGDLSIAEAGHALRTVAPKILDGTFRPQPPRRSSIPKNGGESRVLRLNDIVSRVVASRIAKLIEPHCAGRFSDTSFGCRRDRSPLDLLARLERSIRDEGRRYLGENDVRTCYDSIPVSLAMEELRVLDVDGCVFQLIELFLRNGLAPGGDCGLPTGDPLSPPAMNLLLTSLLDRPLRQLQANTLFLRYVDNLVLSSKSVTDGTAAWQCITERLPSASLWLKYEPAELRDVYDPNNGIQLLGFKMYFSRGRLLLQLTDKSWQKLSQNLQEVWSWERPAETARKVIEGWLTAAGPTIESVAPTAVIYRVREAAAQAGFRELGPVEKLQAALRKGMHSWDRARLRAQRNLGGNLQG